MEPVKPQNDDPSRIFCLYTDLALSLKSAAIGIRPGLPRPQNDDPSRISGLYTDLVLSLISAWVLSPARLVKPENDDPSHISGLYTDLALSLISAPASHRNASKLLTPLAFPASILTWP